MKCKDCRGGGRDGAGIRLTPAAPPPTPVGKCLVLCLLLLCGMQAGLAQPVPAEAVPTEDLEHRARFALSGNLADCLFLGTLNAELQYSVHRDWTLQAGVRYNNWTWRHRRDDQFESRRKTCSVGVRWWPWYTYSGWWAGARLQYEEYNRGGIVSPQTEEGDAFGLSLGGGYAVHVNRWLNVDFGLYAWGGVTRYVTYACPYCGKRTGEGSKAFLLADELRVALQFIF